MIFSFLQKAKIADKNANADLGTFSNIIDVDGLSDSSLIFLQKGFVCKIKIHEQFLRTRTAEFRDEDPMYAIAVASLLLTLQAMEAVDTSILR